MTINPLVDSIQRVLQENRLRMTQPRIAVIQALEANADRFLSPEEIFNQIRQSRSYRCDRVSVYRILRTFTQLNIVSKSDFHGEASRFRLSPNISPKPSHHHEHFFRCLACNDISPIEGCFVMGHIRKMESKGYRHITHHLEMSGTCPSCTTP